MLANYVKGNYLRWSMRMVMLCYKEEGMTNWRNEGWNLESDYEDDEERDEDGDFLALH
jgi:hypothetical protein